MWWQSFKGPQLYWPIPYPFTLKIILSIKPSSPSHLAKYFLTIKHTKVSKIRPNPDNVDIIDGVSWLCMFMLLQNLSVTNKNLHLIEYKRIK